MGLFEKLVIKIGNWGTLMGAVFMSAIALIITATVVGRALRIALPGTFDLVETLVVVGIAFALVYGQLQDRHLRAEIAIERLHGRVKSGIESFLGVLNLFYWVVLLCAGAAMLQRQVGEGGIDGDPESSRRSLPRGLGFCAPPDVPAASLQVVPPHP